MKYLYLFGEYISKNYGNKFYGKCQNLTILLTRAYDEALSKYDVLIMPTLPFIAPKLPVKNDSVKGRWHNSWFVSVSYLLEITGCQMYERLVLASMRMFH